MCGGFILVWGLVVRMVKVVLLYPVLGEERWKGKILGIVRFVFELILYSASSKGSRL